MKFTTFILLSASLFTGLAFGMNRSFKTNFSHISNIDTVKKVDTRSNIKNAFATVKETQDKNQSKTVSSMVQNKKETSVKGTKEAIKVNPEVTEKKSNSTQKRVPLNDLGTSFNGVLINHKEDSLFMKRVKQIGNVTALTLAYAATIFTFYLYHTFPTVQA